MFLYVCKQTFRNLYGWIAPEFLGLRMRNFQDIILISISKYREIFKSALAYSDWNILCADMRSDKFVGMVRMLSIYGRKYDIIFKDVEMGKCYITSAIARKFPYWNLRTRWLGAKLMEETNLFTSIIEAKFSSGKHLNKTCWLNK